MLNPAWRPTQEHADRLLDISHHFLSETPAMSSPEVAADVMQLPVLLALTPDTHTTPEAGYVLHALARQLNLPGATGLRWNLQHYKDPATTPRSDFVLLQVDPTLESTRTAYGLVKQLRTCGNENIGVLFRANDDLAAARRCYRRLAVASIQFLNQPLINLGWLPNPGPHFAAALAHAAQIIHSQRRERAPLEVVQ
jgi:hypothetical protein